MVKGLWVRKKKNKECCSNNGKLSPTRNKNILDRKILVIQQSYKY